MQNGSISQQIADLDELAARELSQAQRDLNEVRVLIRQTTGEVERLTQRNSQSVAKQREAEANLENLGRQELKDIFAAASEAQLRLFMMQSELEQLQSRQRSLTKYVEILQRVVEVASAVRSGVLPTGAAPVNPSPPASQIREPSIGHQSNPRIVQAQEAERYRIAREIHDGPAQALTNIILRAEICERLIEIDPVRARSEMAELKDLVAGTLRDTRGFIFDVRPMILDDLGLFATLRKYIETIEEKSRFGVELVVLGQERRMPSHIEVTMFRIVQEALYNIAQHAKSSRCQVTLDLKTDRIDVMVEDDGMGFNVEEVVADAREQEGTTFGIARMIERAEMLGGRITFESSSGKGTRVTATIPLRS